MNAELYPTHVQENPQESFRPPDDSKQASEKMLLEMTKVPECKEKTNKCVTPAQEYGKLDRFLLPGEMKITHLDTPAVNILPGGDTISQKGTAQRLTLRDGNSIEVNGDGTFAVRDARGNRMRPDEMMIKPGPGENPRGIHLVFDNGLYANIVDGTMNFRTRDGAGIVVDNRGFASISRSESLRLDEMRKR